ncbi:MAG: flavodoxin family protein [Candidatus Aenigmarchaeota archaeon]|nr:flavodoxin family protein [Candidatus Aenigmarchaeota archaeon]
MHVLIILKSEHHGNTKKIAECMARVLKARLADPDKIKITELNKYGLIGFGSGIYYMKHHKALLNLIDKLPYMKGKKAFIFSTSGMRRIPIINNFNKALKNKLLDKGFEIVGKFNCRGWDTYPLFVRPFGGISKGRPNETDFNKAEEFAKGLEVQL